MKRYKTLCEVGSGACGTVYKVQDGETLQIFAAKQIHPWSIADGVSSGSIREISILKELQHENIIRLIDVVYEHKDLNLILEYADINLMQRMCKSPEYFENSHNVKMSLYQILHGVSHCHYHRVLHRDLKPENLLIHLGTNSMKISDFGLSRFFGRHVKAVTRDIGTRSYRAPEILLGSTEYSAEVDVWSIGCIFSDMLNLKNAPQHRRKPEILFPGESNSTTLYSIFSVLGTPTEETWPGVTSLPGWKNEYFPDFPHEHLASKFPSLDEAGLDLLAKMLCLDPTKRISAYNAMQHHYFQDLKIENRSLEPHYNEEEYMMLIKNEDTSPIPLGMLTETFISDLRIQDIRVKCIDHILKASEDLCLNAQTTFISTVYLDRVLSKKLIKKDGVKPFAMACLSLALKMDGMEITNLELTDRKDSTNRKEIVDILEAELMVLDNMDWRLMTITPFSFLPTIVAKICGIYSLEDMKRIENRIIRSLEDITMLTHKPSVVATAAVLSSIAESEEIVSCYHKLNR